MLEFEYLKTEDADKFAFYRIPKVLFTDRTFRKLSCEAKVVYGLMLDRIGLSIKNNWVDEENHIYIIFTAEEIAELMGCGKQKAYKLLAELDTDEGIGLIERCRRGQGKVNITYVKSFVQRKCGAEPVKSITDEPKTGESAGSSEGDETKGGAGSCERHEDKESTDAGLAVQGSGNESYFLKYKNHTSESMNFIFQEVWKSYPNNTDINNTDMNDTNLILSSPNPSPAPSGSPQPEKPYDARGEEVKRWSNIREEIKNQIGYDVLCIDYRQETVDEILEIMTEIVSGKRKSMMISGERVPGDVVRGRFQKIDMFHVQYVLNCLDESRVRIHNVKKYLIASLYNAPTTISTYYDNQVRSNGAV